MFMKKSRFQTQKLTIEWVACMPHKIDPEKIKNRQEQHEMWIDETIIRTCTKTNNSDLDTHLLTRIIKVSAEVAVKQSDIQRR